MNYAGNFQEISIDPIEELETEIEKTESTDTMIIGLENKMENMKIDIMKIVAKQLDSFKFQQKLMKEQESLSIFCFKCRDKHPLKSVLLI